GLALGSLLFMHRSSKQIMVYAQQIKGKTNNTDTTAQTVSASDPDIVIYRISGPLFFGATASIGAILDRIHDDHKTLVMDFSDVPFLDSTGGHMIEGIVHKAHRRGVTVWLTGANRAVMRALLLHGMKKPMLRYASSIDAALARQGSQ
ncbi:MAG: sodium-independent anion transporter, partial [Roseinatronobacter sp.]|nr:sodium-independent anion transporter [Roseinatronobacter sp.]